MRKKIFSIIFIVVIIALVFSTILMTNIFYSISVKQLESEIENEAEYLQVAIDEEDLDSYDFVSVVGEDNETRITLIESDGTVIYDNYADISEMENHSNRPEVIAALEDGSGEDERVSATLGVSSVYYAVLLDDGNVLRVGTDVTNAVGLMFDALFWMVMIAIAALIIAMIIAHFLTKSILKPINEIDLDKPLDNERYDEISPLLRKMDYQKKEIQRQISAVNEKQREFDYITENMNEGLLILGEHGKVLSINDSAIEILGNKSDTYVGLCRDINFLKAVEEAFSGNAVFTKMEKDNKIYKISASPVTTHLNLDKEDSDSEVSFGTVVFIVDISDSEYSERMRKEFSANVSHELKTPLTSIMGYAEIISNGIAKKDDVPEFANKIRMESERLLALIEDIINLSRLDEQNIIQEFQDVDLLDIVNKVKDSLSHKAEIRGIKINFNCENAIINGYAPVLDEMIFNLMDNAINYNSKNGSVDVKLERRPGPGIKAMLTIKDTGVGIAPEHQHRVFERFYRVDKSHSKATGGTGLGLSIVKHGASLHGATIELNSEENKGTEIILRFM